MSGIKRERIFLKLYSLIKNTLIFVVFPSKCKICSKKLKFGEKTVCNECLRKISLKRINEKPFYSEKQSNYFAIFEYKDEIKDLIVTYKYKGYLNISNIISDYISDFILKDNLRYDFLTFVPSHKSRLKERGFDHMKIIAKKVSKKTGIRYIELFIKKRKTLKQAELRKKDRWGNIKNSIKLSNKCKNLELKNKKILVLDDIYTTGSTVKELKRALFLKEKNIFLDFLFFSFTPSDFL